MKAAKIASQCASLPDNAPHVLVVDDDQKIRDLLGRYLTEHGFRVTTAADAASATRRPPGSCRGNQRER